jgi:hypothetical protein
MRNKDLFEQKMERVESIIKLVGYHIHRDEKDQAYELVGKSLNVLEEMFTLLRTETQD